MRMEKLIENMIRLAESKLGSTEYHCMDQSVRQGAGQRGRGAGND